MDDHDDAATAARDPVALAEAPEDVPTVTATARALRLDERNTAAEIARQQDELRRFRQDMAQDRAQLRTDGRGGGRGARRPAQRRAPRASEVSSGSERSMASARGSVRG